MLRVLLGFFLAVSAYASPKDDLLVSMRNEMSRIAEPLPDHYDTYMNHITTNHSYALGSATPDELDALITSWKLPADVTALFQQSAFATTAEFQTFTFRAAPSYTDFQEYLGAAKFVDGIIVMSYMHVLAAATPITQKNKVSVRTCHRCWLVATCCSSATAYVPRGFTAPEIELMLKTLRASAFNRLVADFPTSFLLTYRTTLDLPENF